MVLRFVTKIWRLMGGEFIWAQGIDTSKSREFTFCIYSVFLTTIVSPTAWFHSMETALLWRLLVRFPGLRNRSSVIWTLRCPHISDRASSTTTISSSVSAQSVCTAIRAKCWTIAREKMRLQKKVRRETKKSGRGNEGGDDRNLHAGVSY